jgi:hypothetical protein
MLTLCSLFDRRGYMNNYDERTNDANIKINDELEDGTIRTHSDGIEKTNQKLNNEFYEGGEEAENMAPTYLYNNTPAIKINEKSK